MAEHEAADRSRRLLKRRLVEACLPTLQGTGRPTLEATQMVSKTQVIVLMATCDRGSWIGLKPS